MDDQKIIKAYRLEPSPVVVRDSVQFAMVLSAAFVCPTTTSQ